MKQNFSILLVIRLFYRHFFLYQGGFFFKKTRSLLIFLVFSLFSSYLYAGLPVRFNGQEMPSLAPMLELTMPAVVNISTTKQIRIMENPLLRDPFFRHFFQLPRQQRRQQQNSLGSGVIIDSQRGYIVTNHHVIDKADKITVTLTDGRQLNATLLGTDPAADVAVIQISADHLTQLPIADSNQLRVGDFVVAIGNPFGLGQTVTSGIISALGRNGLGIEGYEDFIQTDASINPGNSGGALVNLRGEFIGMNTAILAPSGGNVGIGFAIPANMVMTLKTSLVKHGKVKRGLLGITTQDLTHQLIKALNLNNTHGAIVSKVTHHSPAEKAGLKPGDIILSINHQTIKNSHQIRNMIGLLSIGSEVLIDILRGNKRQQLTATIGKLQRTTLKGKYLHKTLTGTLLASTQKETVEGVVFVKIKPDSYAWFSGLRPNDIIVSANQYRVRNLQQLKQVIDPHRPLLINIQRGTEAFFLILK